jgi:hypothetical protein
MSERTPTCEDDPKLLPSLSVTVRLVRGQGHMNGGRLVRVWCVEAGLHARDLFGAIECRWAGAAGAGAPDSTHGRFPRPAEIEELTRAGAALWGGTSTPAVCEVNWVMSNIGDAPTILPHHVWSCLSVDAVWRRGDQSHVLRHAVHYDHRWGVVGRDAEPFREFVAAVVRCCGDDPDILCMGVLQGRVPPSSGPLT